jgi:hypothetical protein
MTPSEIINGICSETLSQRTKKIKKEEELMGKYFYEMER